MKKIKAGPLFSGVLVMLLVSLGLSAIFAFLFSGGVLPLGAMRVVAWGITLVCCFLGGLWISNRVSTMPLPMTLGAVACYLLLIFVLRGLIFGTVAEPVAPVVGMAAVGGILGALVAAGKGGKRR